MKVLSELEISKAFPLSGISYVLIVAAGWFLFGEPVAWLQLVGGGLILTGAWLIATAHNAEPQIISQAIGSLMPEIEIPNRATSPSASLVGRFSDFALARALSKIVKHGTLAVTSAGGRTMTFGDGTGRRSVSSSWTTGHNGYF